MPEIRVQHIVSVSSEDKRFPAENLVKGDGFKKWKCAVGERSATVTLQFEKASEIVQIDIGNEGSAFVEVLVGKSGCKDEDYQVILVASSFMTPVDSRNNQNLNKVRLFPLDALSKAVAGQKWDRAKVICTQPFNKNMQFGLSFIKLYSTPDLQQQQTQQQTQQLAGESGSVSMSLGAFSLRGDTAEPAPIRTGTLFERSRQKSDLGSAPPAPLSGAAAIRAASRDAAGPIAYIAVPQASTNKASDQSEQTRATPVVAAVQSQASKVKRTPSNSSTASNESGAGARGLGADKTQPVKVDGAKVRGKSEDDRSPAPKRAKGGDSGGGRAGRAPRPFERLMGGVRFVISAIENPARGQLRERALEMGAVYKPDWDKTCTHLVCAYENTPKYAQVKGKGRIVTKDWINDCYQQRKLLLWRKYRLGRAPSPPPTESESSDDEPPRPLDDRAVKQSTAAGVTPGNSVIKGAGGAENRTVPPAGKQADPFNASTDSESDTAESNHRPKPEPPQLKLNPPQPPPSNALDRTLEADRDIFNASTDEESSPLPPSSAPSAPSGGQRVNGGLAGGAREDGGAVRGGELPELPDFFAGKIFFLYGTFAAAERRTLVRYIIAYSGKVEDYMDKSVNVVLSSDRWDEHFDQAVSDNATLCFVRPAWVHACYDQQALLPMDKFLISPD